MNAQIKLILIFLILSLSIRAQTISLSGRVVSETNTPIKGCIVTLRGYGIKDTTGSDGKFLLQKSSTAIDVNRSLKSNNVNVEIVHGTLMFSLNSPQNVTFTIYDMRGRVQSSISKNRLSSGIHRFAFNELLSNKLSQGTFIAVLTTGSEKTWMKVTSLNGIYSVSNTRSIGNLSLCNSNQTAKSSVVTDTIDLKATGYKARGYTISTYQGEFKDFVLLKDNTSSTVYTGYFIGSPVVGMRYETSTQSGITGTNGSFKYKQGEYVQFKVGGITVGSAKAQPVMTLISLVSGATSILDSRIVNICVFLQSLDYDQNHSNGITIIPEAHILFKNQTLNLSTKEDYYIYLDEDFYLAMIVFNLDGDFKENDYGVTRVPVLPLDAVVNFYNNIVALVGGKTILPEQVKTVPTIPSTFTSTNPVNLNYPKRWENPDIASMGCYGDCSWNYSTHECECD